MIEEHTIARGHGAELLVRHIGDRFVLAMARDGVTVETPVINSGHVRAIAMRLLEMASILDDVGEVDL